MDTSFARTAAGTVTTVAIGTMPPLRGRDAALDSLARVARHPDGRAQVLVGPGGIGKSALALALVDRVETGRHRRHAHKAWWVSAADPPSLAAGITSVARQLGATSADLEAFGAGAADGPDRLWALLERARSGWLLIFDNADTPDVLSGWLRPTRRGLVVVTTRQADTGIWGRNARVRELERIDDDDATQVLLDLAPDCGSVGDAHSLARRLSGLPLALHLAGTYLGSSFAGWASFASYAQALKPYPRDIVTRTCEISLDALAAHGLQQTRPLMHLLSSFAEATPIPLELLTPELVEPLTQASNDSRDPAAEVEPQGALEETLWALSDTGLLSIVPMDDSADGSARKAIVIHPIVAQANRINEIPH